MQCWCQQTHNSVWNFQNVERMVRFQLPTPSTCRHCHACPFYYESHDMCCSSWKVSFSHVSAPQELLQIFLDTSLEGRHFRQHIRSYNHVLSFTSLVVHVNENILETRGGNILFGLQGKRITTLEDFIQMMVLGHASCNWYIYDTEHELQNRMLENPQLYQIMVYKLQQILHRYNPLVCVFRQLAPHPNVRECSLLIKERLLISHNINSQLYHKSQQLLSMKM